jgi:hemerythrin-like domain-containing protein
MDPIDALMREHRAIEHVLATLSRASELGRSGAAVPAQLFLDAVAFLRRYADGVHHAKEERHLFPMLERSGMGRDGGPLSCMLAEHDGARKYTAHIAEEAELARLGGVGGSTLLYQAGLLYSRHMAQHIQKEDGVLFKMARLTIDEEGMAELSSAFERIDAATPGFEARAIAVASMLEQAPSAR